MSRVLGPMLRCECEHADHFPTYPEATRVLRKELGEGVKPELRGHAYGVEFPEQHIEPVKTPFGTFAACPACRETCLADYAVEPPTNQERRPRNFTGVLP